MTVWNYPRVFVADIIAEVSHVFRVPEAALQGKTRSRPIVRPRQVCCYLSRHLTPLSYPQIGRHLGGRDHSTILHGRWQAENLMSRSAEFTAYVDAVRIRLLTTRARAEQRRQEALAVERERLRMERAQAESIATAEQAPPVPDDLDDLSNAVAAYVAKGGSFVEVYA